MDTILSKLNTNEITDEITDEITENIISIDDTDIKTFLNNNRDINILWGVQPRDKPTLEFLIPIMQIMKFLKHGIKLTILLADIHELLESPHLDMNIIKYRCEAYKELITQLIELFDVNPGNIIFYYGSDFQTSSNYTMDIYKISSLTSIKDTYKSREIDMTDIDISINSSDKKMTNMLYPILQALDEKYTNCDAFYGSITQKNMCMFSKNLMKNFRNNEKNIVYMLQDITKKIDISFFDPMDTVINKLNDFPIDDIYYLCEHILFPLLYYKSDKIIIDTKIIENYKDFTEYISLKKIEKNKIVEIVSESLSKHLDKFYYELIDSRFMYYFDKGWIGAPSNYFFL